MDWLVTFDVSSDRARRTVTRALERRGPRVAHSVFVVRGAEAGMDRIVAALADAVGRDGHLLAVPLCPACDVAVTGRAWEVFPYNGWVT